MSDNRDHIGMPQGLDGLGLDSYTPAALSVFERMEQPPPPVLPAEYRPSDDEPFMNPTMQEYFRRKLNNWRAELLRDSSGTLAHLQEDSLQEADIADRATLETERAIELRTRDRERKLIQKIDDALQRLENGEYGYCEDTGEPISLRRLEARPIATLSLEAQERHERLERTQRDD
jgi:DnaK suppressor protein